MESLSMSDSGKSSPPEVLISKPKSWETLVADKYKNICANCGGSDRLKAKMIVPAEAGGQTVESNGVLLCRPCDLASEMVYRPDQPQRRLVNFWVSKKFVRLDAGKHWIRFHGLSNPIPNE
jgi:hypothetical protein